ncbi:hypothetical protein Tco_0129077 [Tanacetum coccineum]
MAKGPTSPCGGSHESGGDSSPRGGNDKEQDSSGKAVLAREFLYKCTSGHSESYTGNGEVRIAGNLSSNEDGVTQCLECLDFAIMAVILLLLLLPADKRASPPKIPVSTQCFIIVALELSKGANSLQAEEQDIPPPTITAMKIPIIRKGEYDIWSMRMRQYICHTDHNLWDVIVNGDLEEEPAPTGDQSGPSAPPAPKTAKQLAARRNQERVKSILLLAIPDEYLLKFHNVACRC